MEHSPTSRRLPSVAGNARRKIEAWEKRFEHHIKLLWQRISVTRDEVFELFQDGKQRGINIEPFIAQLRQVADTVNHVALVQALEHLGQQEGSAIVVQHGSQPQRAFGTYEMNAATAMRSTENEPPPPSRCAW